MEKPTLRTFLLLYGMLWLVLCVIAVVNGPPGYPFLSISFANIAVVFINLVGFVIVSITGWVPWHDDDA